MVKFFFRGSEHEVMEVGFFRLGRTPEDVLTPGQVGYVIANIKTVSDIKIGDTITQ